MMKRLNKKATKIFCKLLDKVTTQYRTELTATRCGLLTIERELSEITMPQGTGYLLYIADVSKGYKTPDPGMTFVVIDHRRWAQDFESIGIYPQSYIQDIGDGDILAEESIIIKNRRFNAWKPIWYYGHLTTANNWLVDVIAHNYL
jgi:hypothetical protein